MSKAVNEKWKKTFPDTIGNQNRPAEGVDDTQPFETGAFPQYMANDPVRYDLQNAAMSQSMSNDARLKEMVDARGKELDDHKVDPGAHKTGIAGNAATATKVVTNAASGASANIAEASMASSDSARIRVSGANNAGELALETADDGNEAIVARQYTGDFKDVARTAAILDANGNTSFPGTVVAPKFTGALNGNATTASKLASPRTISLTGNATGSASFDGSTNASINVTSVNADTASKLSTARKINITGNATGAANFDGTGDISINTTVNESKHAAAADKATNDGNGADITETYLKKAGDTATGAMTFKKNIVLQDGLTSTGAFVIDPNTMSYNEALRLNESTAKWATIYMGAPLKSTSGSNDNAWGISRTPNRQLDFFKGASYTTLNTGLRLNGDGTALLGGKEVVKNTGTWDISITGNSSTADKLKTPRTISLTGNATGSTTFDGTSDITIDTTVAEAAHADKATNDGNGDKIDDTYLKKATVIDVIYPVGSIYMSMVDTDPATLFGVGTWARISQGRMLLGADDSTYEAGATGGEATHTLSVNEMPAHSHDISNSGDHTHQVSRNIDLSNADPKGWGGSRDTINDYDGGTNFKTSSAGAHTHTIDNAGGGAAHNNMPPYLVCYIWQRTA